MMAVEYSDEMLFTDGIATISCVCCNAEGTKIFGFDGVDNEFVMIEFCDGMKRTSYSISLVLKQARWYRMLYISNVSGNEEFLALVSIFDSAMPTEEVSIVRFSLSDNELHLSHSSFIDREGDPQKTDMQLLRCAETDRNFYIRLVQQNVSATAQATKTHDDNGTVVTLIEIITQNEDALVLQMIHDGISLGNTTYCPVLHGDRIYFYNPNIFRMFKEGPVAMAEALSVLPINGSPNRSNDYLYAHPAFGDDNYDFCPVLGSSKNEIFYFLYNATANISTLLGINTTGNEVRQHFTLNEHPVRTEMVLFSNNRIIINGFCCNRNCFKWHTYHFVLPERLIPFCALDLTEVDALLSLHHMVIFCGEYRIQMILAWLFRTLTKHNSTSLTLFVTDLTTALFSYAVTFSRWPLSITGRIRMVPVGAVEDVQLETVNAVVDRLTELSYSQLMSLKMNSNFFIVLNKLIAAGLDYPKERIKWIAATESVGPNNYKPIPKPHHPLDLYYPNWKGTFTNDSIESLTILIPPCADIEKTYMNKDNSGVAGRDAEGLFVQKFLKLSIGGIMVTGIKSKEFLKAHNSAYKKHFEIDGLFFHQRYGIIVFECKAGKIKGIGPLEERKLIKNAVDQLRNLKTMLPIVYESSTNAESPPPFISLVIVVPHSRLTKVEKDDFGKKNEIEIWDIEDLEPYNMRTKLLAVKEKCPDHPHESLTAFAKKTAACRSLSFISPKHNAWTLNNVITQQAHLKKPVDDREQLHWINVLYGSGVQSQPIYLSPEQQQILDDDAHKIQIVSGPPGTGKTLLMLLKVLKLAKNSDFTERIYVQTESQGQVPEMQNFFELNLSKWHNFPIVCTDFFRFHQDPDAAFFMDELFAKGKIFDIVKERIDYPATTFLCITGSHFPAELSQKAIERHLQTEFNDSDHLKHTFLSTVYRGSENIINDWKQIYGRSFSLTVGHQIRGYEVEIHEKLSLKQIYGHLVKGINRFRGPDTGEPGRAVAAVFVDNFSVLDAVRTFVSLCEIPCGTVLEHVRYPHLIPVDRPYNCLSLEWPVVFYVETGIGYLFDSNRFIASSRAIVKLVILKRDIMFITELFARILQRDQIDPVELSIKDFVLTVQKAQRIIYRHVDEELVDNCGIHDEFVIVLWYDYWPTELKRYSPFINCSHFCEALRALSENEVALLQVLCAKDDIGDNFVRNFRGTPVYDRDRVPQYLRIIWSDQSVEEVERKWTICYELCNKITQTMELFLKCDVKAERVKVKRDFGDDFVVLEIMASRIWWLYIVCLYK